MAISSRRRFIGEVAMAGTVTLAAPAFNIFASKEMFIHHVYFWLNNPESAADRDKLIAGLRKLANIKTIKMFHIGQPAATDREVIDRSYSVSWLLIFGNKTDQDSYQTDPIHLKFVEECSSLWRKVIVYDSADI